MKMITKHKKQNKKQILYINKNQKKYKIYKKHSIY